jgi:unsaturated rhamnogalacturonyl hydrolase
VNERRLLAAVAARAASLRYRIWGFGEGHALLGLLAAGDLLDRPELITRVDELVTPSLSSAAALPDEHLMPVEVLLRLRELRDGSPVGPAVESWVGCLERAPRPVAGRPAVHRPDLIGLDRLVWVDCMHTDGPGLALARPERAAPALREYVYALQDSSGLFSHGYDVVAGRANLVHWGRGQGWALHGLVGALTDVPDAGLAASLDALLNGLAEHELAEAGRWRTIVDADSPVELSVSALVAAGVLTGMAAGVVDGRWAGLAERALAAAVGETVDGVLPVSEATPVGTPVTYRTRATGCHPWGQGPLLVALAAAGGWPTRPKGAA